VLEDTGETFAELARARGVAGLANGRGEDEEWDD
jgi:hypothetical protein